MGLLSSFLQALFSAPSHSHRPQSRSVLYCSNKLLHPRPFLLKKRVYWWGGKALCRRCYRHYTANIHVCRHWH